MMDLHDFKNQQIKALQTEVCTLNEYITRLETFIFELTEENYPNDYKKVIRQELFGSKNED
jgi:hypothetical protein